MKHAIHYDADDIKANFKRHTARHGQNMTDL